MATYYDGLNDFHKLNEQKPLASSAQLVYLHLLQLNNRYGNSGYIQVSDRQLEYLTSLNKNTITQAKRTLKNLGLIDFKSNAKKPREGTNYSLNFFTLGQNMGQNVGQSVGQKLGQTLSNSSLTSTQEDLRLKKEDEEKSADTANASANGTELDKVLDDWEASGGCKMNMRLATKLGTLLTRYGLAKMTAALELANRKLNGDYGFNLEFFEGKLAEVSQSPKTALKGDERVGKPSDGFKYKPVEFNDAEELW